VSPEQRRYVFIQCGVGAGIANALINGGLGWLATRTTPQFPVWSIPGVGPDIVGTAWGVTFGTVLAMAFQVKHDVARGKVNAPILSEGLAAFVSRFPRGWFKQGVFLGCLAVPLFCPPVILALWVSGVGALDRASFIALKAGFAAVEGAIVTPVIVLGFLQAGISARRSEST
jgi:hypothetical protein